MNYRGLVLLFSPEPSSDCFLSMFVYFCFCSFVSPVDFAQEYYLSLVIVVPCDHETLISQQKESISSTEFGRPVWLRTRVERSVLMWRRTHKHLSIGVGPFQSSTETGADWHQFLTIIFATLSSLPPPPSVFQKHRQQKSRQALQNRPSISIPAMLSSYYHTIATSNTTTTTTSHYYTLVVVVVVLSYLSTCREGKAVPRSLRWAKYVLWPQDEAHHRQNSLEVMLRVTLSWNLK